MTQPKGIAARALPALLYGADHPYGRPFTGTGDAAAVRALTRDELVRFHQTWIRPDNATIFVVGDLPLAELVPQLEARFGDWRPPARAARAQGFDAPLPAPRPRIVLIDRPQSPQSVILAGAAAAGRGHAGPAEPATPPTKCSAATSCRASTWTCASGAAGPTARAAASHLREHQVPYIIQAPVQADRTGESIAGDAAISARLPRHQRRHAGRAARASSTATSASCPGSSRPRRRCSARCAPTRSIAGPTIIGRRSPTAIAA